MNRREFLQTSAFAGFFCFIPKVIKTTWRSTPSIHLPEWDYEMALLEKGREIVGLGYQRVRGKGREDFIQDGLASVNNACKAFPASSGSWGNIDSLRILDRRGRGVFTAPLSYPAHVTTGLIVQFNPNDIWIGGHFPSFLAPTVSSAFTPMRPEPSPGYLE